MPLAELRYQIPSADIAEAFEAPLSNLDWKPITLSDTGKASVLDVGDGGRRDHRCFGLDTGQDWITMSFDAETEIFAYSEDYYD